MAALTSIIGVENEDDKDAYVNSPSDSDEELLLYESASRSAWLPIEMNNVRRNKEPDKILNASYRSFLKSYTRDNTENIYLDNAYIQQVEAERVHYA